jgi:hypothetical protein
MRIFWRYAPWLSRIILLVVTRLAWPEVDRIVSSYPSRLRA